MISRLCAYGQSTGQKLPIPVYGKKYDTITKAFEAFGDPDDLCDCLIALKIRLNGKDSLVSVGGRAPFSRPRV